MHSVHLEFFIDPNMQDRNIKFSIDRGGTFTDVFAQVIRDFDHRRAAHSPRLCNNYQLRRLHVTECSITY